MTDPDAEARRLLAEALKVDAAGIADDASIETTVGWDSIVHLELVMAMEDLLDMEIPSDEAVDIATLDDVKRLLAKYAGKAGS